VAGSATQVDETALGEEDNVATVLHEVTVDLGLDVADGLGVGLEPRNVDFDVEVTDVADDGVVGHGLKVHASENVTAAGGGDKDLALGSSLLHGCDLETGDGSLEGVDGIDLRDNDASTHAVESLGAALTDITEASNDSDLASNHDISGTLDAIDERLAAAVEVVELGLGDGVVDVDGGNQEALALQHAVEVVHTGGGLFGHTVAVLEHLRVLLVDEGSQVAAVVEDQVEVLAVLEGSELLLEAPLVFLLGLTLPGEDGHAGSSNGGGGVVLGGEDVARCPGELGTQSLERLDEHSRLDGCGGVSGATASHAATSKHTHVQAAGNAGALQRLVLGVLPACLHETRHLVLGELNLTAAKRREAEVGDLVLVGGGRHDGMCVDKRIRGIWREEGVKKRGEESVWGKGKKLRAALTFSPASRKIPPLLATDRISAPHPVGNSLATASSEKQRYRPFLPLIGYTRMNRWYSFSLVLHWPVAGPSRTLMTSGHNQFSTSQFRRRAWIVISLCILWP